VSRGGGIVPRARQPVRRVGRCAADWRLQTSWREPSRQPSAPNDATAAIGDENTQATLRLTPESPVPRSTAHTLRESRPPRHPHPVLKGFDETDILPFGRSLAAIDVSAPARGAAEFCSATPRVSSRGRVSRQTTTDLPASWSANALVRPLAICRGPRSPHARGQRRRYPAACSPPLCDGRNKTTSHCQ